MPKELTYKPRIWKTQTNWPALKKQTPVPVVWAVAALDISNPAGYLYEEHDTWEQALNGALRMNYTWL